jgi:hypothetical protein
LRSRADRVFGRPETSKIAWAALRRAGAGLSYIVAIARCAAIAQVVIGGRRYGRTVGTTLAPALSADAAVTIVVPGSWTPVPSPKSIK